MGQESAPRGIEGSSFKEDVPRNIINGLQQLPPHPLPIDPRRAASKHPSKKHEGVVSCLPMTRRKSAPSHESQPKFLFQVTSNCHRLGLRSRAIVCRQPEIRPSQGELNRSIAREVDALRERFESAAAVQRARELQLLHEIFRQVGVNPRKLQPSCERLIRLMIRKGRLPSINNLVDACNLVSARYVCSIGAHDLQKISPPVTLTLLEDDLPFLPLASREKETALAGEFGYIDARERLICRLDVVQAGFSKISQETSEALLIIGATAAHDSDVVERIFSDLIELLTGYCGGTAKVT